MEKDQFLEIITQNQGIIHKVCGIYCDTGEDRQDLFQEIVAQLWHSFHRFRNESKVTTGCNKVA
jgi:RNA polymerase sigma-70 factor (ECF subfamily)